MADNTKDDNIALMGGPVLPERLTAIWSTVKNPKAEPATLGADKSTDGMDGPLARIRNPDSYYRRIINPTPEVMPEDCNGPDRNCWGRIGYDYCRETRWYLKGRIHRDDGPAIERENGTKLWYRNGQLHRDDGPAIEYPDNYYIGSERKEWYRNGQRHRDDGPAIEHQDGAKEWYRNGQRHRDDGPAIEYPRRYYDYAPHPRYIPESLQLFRKWYRNGQLHRDGGPAVEREDGTKEWYRNGQFHRDGGPAVEREDGTKEWYRNGQRHRDDGPAIEYPNGNRVWYYNGQSVSGEDFNRMRGALAWTRQLY